MAKPTFLRLRDAGHYEFGLIEYGKDRRKDKMIKIGEAASYQEASRECERLAFSDEAHS